MRPLVPIAALPALALGCALAPRGFDAVENATLPSPAGLAAAQYDVEGDIGELAHVEVWSGGVYRARVDGVERTLVEVNLRVEPDAGRDAVLVRDTLALDAVQTDHRRILEVSPLRVDRARPLEGGATEYTAYFALPEGVRPGDVRSFRVRWQVRAGDVTYGQRTPFLEALPPPYAWTWGWSWGWGWPFTWPYLPPVGFGVRPPPPRPRPGPPPVARPGRPS
jgi:hypothetical protein